MKLSLSIFFSLIVIFTTFGDAFSQTGRIDKVKKSIVRLESSREFGFVAENVGTYTGTGFVVDSKERIIATNKHLVLDSPANLSVTFWDGRKVRAEVLYIDPTHDFAFITYNSSLEEKYPAIPFGDYSKVKQDDFVCIIGSNDSEEYSYKEGRIVNLRKNKGDIYSQTIQSSFESAGGSSGSPLLNKKMEAIGIHFAGNDHSSFELPISYLKDKLATWKKQKTFTRGEIGIAVESISLFDADKFLKLPRNIVSSFEDSNKLKVLYVISQVNTVFKVGDIIYKVDGKEIADNFYELDRIIDSSILENIEFEIFRYGVKKHLITKVMPSSNNTINEFLSFSGAVFHNVSMNMRLEFQIEPEESVVLTFVRPGSLFFQIGQFNDNSNRISIITKVNNKSIKSVKDLYDSFKVLKDGDKLTVESRDIYLFSMKTEISFISFDQNKSNDNLKYFRRSGMNPIWKRYSDKTIITSK